MDHPVVLEVVRSAALAREEQHGAPVAVHEDSPAPPRLSAFRVQV